jgi:ribosome biogenesis GTPase
MGPVRGTVTKILGASSMIDCGPAGVFQCGLRSRLSRKGGVRLAVGDRVMVTPSDVASGEAAVAAPAQGMIEEVDPRRTVLRRVRDLKREYVVCANVDRIFIVVAVSDPPYSRPFIDRLIVGVERDALSPVLVVNKIDLTDRESRALVARAMGVYGALGYSVLLVSAETGEGIDAVREAFRGRISAVVGPSGAGKSSLLNLVSPGASLLIGKVSEHDGRGRHTTTAAELVPLVAELGEHGFVIDTPGLSDFGLGDIALDELLAGFREIARAAVECRFKNCGHRAEPGCAVLRDVETGAIDEGRYASWLKLREEINAEATGRQATRRR